MKKLLVMLALMAAFSATGFSAEVFTEFFESGLGNWTSTGTWATSTTDALNVTSARCSTCNSQNISNITSLAGYFGDNGRLNITFGVSVWNVDNTPPPEGFFFWYYNGSVWNNSNKTVWISGTNPDYVYYNYTVILQNANVSNFQMRFMCNVSASTESCIVDDIRIHATTMAVDSTPPSISNWLFNVSNSSNYSSIQGYQFNATVSDVAGISNVWVEHNFSGTLRNYSSTGNVGSSYYYNNATLGAGFYYVKWYANDTLGNLNNTDLAKYYQVNKSYLPISLYINETNGDMTLNNNSNANFTANFSAGKPFTIEIWSNLTGNWAQEGSGASPYELTETLNPYQARVYTIKANWSGNQNYTYSQANHSLTLNVLYGWLNITYQTPLNGSSTAYGQNAVFNVTINFTCIGGTCGNVNATLKYNATASYPNADVSNVTGATPFFTSPFNKRQRNYTLTVGSGSQANVVNPSYAFDNAYGDTTTYAQITSNDTTYAYLNVSYITNLTSDSYIYYAIKTYALRLSLYAYNWTSGAFQLVNNVTSGSSIVVHKNRTDSSWVNSTGGILYKFGKEAYNEYTDFYDVYLKENDTNPKTCPSMASGSNCSVTWYVNATRASGEYWFNVTFDPESGAVNSTSPNFQINTSDTTAPNIANFLYNVTTGSNYSSIQGYQFNATVTDPNLDKVWIEHNFTGTRTNYTVTTASGSEYYYNYGKLAAGYYYIKWYANDTGGYKNTTDSIKYYRVNKSYLPITLYINGTDGDKVLYDTSIANFTANFSSSYSFNITLYTNLTGTMALWDNQASPLMNYTALSQYQARVYLIKANWTGNQNYTYSQANHSLTLNVLYGWLNVSYQSPATGNSQSLFQNAVFNVTMNVTCVLGTCGNVTGVLRYNDSAGLNPDTNVSMTAGATPFYMPNVRRTNVASDADKIYSVAIGDAKNDETTEFVSAGDPYWNNKIYMGAISIYNKAGGVWTEEWIDTSLNIYYYSVAVGDANNDGLDETVVGANSGTTPVRMYVNESGEWNMYNIANGNSGVAYSVAVGDADNDGLNEVVAGLGYSAVNEVRMYKNVSGGWIESNISDVGEDVWSVAIGDADNDGLNEIVVGIGEYVTNKVRMYENVSSNWIETNISDETVAVYSVAIGDADNDGQNDVVVGMGSTTYEVRMYENKTGDWIETNVSNVLVAVNSVAIGDADNDNRKEIVIGTESTSYEVRVYENVSGTWVETNVSDHNSVYGIAIGDINDYGLNSIVAGGYEDTAYLIKVLDIQSNPISCGLMSAGESCYIKWTVNVTGAPETHYWLDANFSSSYSQIASNDSGDFQIKIATLANVGILNVTLIDPIVNISVLRNRIFTMGIRVVCLGVAGASCYEVYTYPSYGTTSPSFAISTTVGATPFFVAGTYSELSRDDANMILRMHMDNTGSDSATMVYDETNRNNGTKLGDGSPAWSDGRFDSGLSFDGYDDYFNVSTVSALNMYGKNLTIEFWFRPNKSTFPADSAILARNWDDTGNISYMLFWDAGQALQFLVMTGGTPNTLGGVNPTWVPGKWYHVAATFNGSRSALYIDGALDNAGNYAGGNIDKSDNILIVGAKNKWGEFFNGSIDELAIYNRTKNATEIAQDYRSSEHSCSILTLNDACKVVWAINATGAVLSNWVLDAYFYSSNYSLSDNDTTNFNVSIAPITGCGQYVNCAYPNCLQYRDTTTTVQSMDSRQKVWSTFRTCWS